MTIELGVNAFRVAFAAYAISALLYVIFLRRKSGLTGQRATLFLIVGLFAHVAAITIRTIAAGRPPFMNVYEFIMSFTFALTIIYLVIEFNMGAKSLGAFIVPLIAIFALAGNFMSSEVNPTMPALRSMLRVPHISSALLAYAAFGVASMLAITYLIQARAERTNSVFWLNRLPSAKTLDRIIYRTVAFGFFMLTIGIITGSIWAQVAWGKYWTWDPKEVWSAITWLIYAAFLHTRVTMGWRGRKSAILALVGFIATLMTLFGVTYLMRSMHSYR